MTCSVALVYLTTGPRLIRRLGRETAAVSYSSFTHHHTLPDALCFVGYSTKRAEDWDNKLSLPPSILWFFVFRRENKYLSQFITRHTVFYHSKDSLRRAITISLVFFSFPSRSSRKSETTARNISRNIKVMYRKRVKDRQIFLQQKAEGRAAPPFRPRVL
jgi:hypothetical protein